MLFHQHIEVLQGFFSISMKNILFSFIFLALIACNDKNSDDNDYSEWLLDKKYDFIVGVLSPDSLCDHPQEIFIGKAKPNVDAPPVALGEDEVMNRVLLTMRQWYFAEITGKTDAEVWVEHENAEKVQFTHIKDGIYRDVNNDLKIIPSHTYNLTVMYDDNKIFTGNTTIPGRFNFTNVANGDTVDVYDLSADINSPFNKGIYLEWSLPSGSTISRVNHEYIYRPFYTVLELFHEYETIVAIYAGSIGSGLELENSIITMDALDSNYAVIYRAGVTHAASEELFAWFDKQNAKTLGERSTVYGGANVGGVFGSFNRAQVTFYARLPEVDDN